MGSYAGQITSRITEYLHRGELYSRGGKPADHADDKDDGSCSFPGATGVPDKNEVELEAEASELLRRENSSLLNTVEDIRKLTASPKQAFSEMEDEYANLLSLSKVFKEKAVQCFDSARKKLTELKREEKALYRELDDFKKDHGIGKKLVMQDGAFAPKPVYVKGKYGIDNRVANYPPKRLSPSFWEGTVSPLGILFLFLFLETVLGAWFFKGELGLMEGAVIAFLFSVLNIFPAFVAGLVFRYKNSKGQIARLCGWLVLIVILPISIYLNSLVAVLRYRYQELLELAASGADATMKLDDMTELFVKARAEALRVFSFALPHFDVLSFCLLIVGLVFAALAFHKGYRFDDPYPGYGARDRRYKVAMARFREASVIVKSEIVNVLEEQRRGFGSLSARLLGRREEVCRLEDSLGKAMQDFLKTVRKIEDDFVTVLHKYFNSKKAANDEALPSMWLSSPKDLLTVKPDDGAAREVAVELRDLRKDIEGMMARASHMTDELTQNINSFLKGDFAAFMKEIDDEAEKLVDKLYNQQ